MVRKQFFIEDSQEAELERIAERRRTSQAELVREAIDALVEAEAERERRRIEAKATLKAIIAEQRAKYVPGMKSRKWTREEMHDRGHGQH